MTADDADESAAPESAAPEAAGGPSEDLEVLHQTVEELRKENEELRASEEHRPAHRGKARVKGIASWVLVVLACILAIISVVAAFARNQLLNTDTYVSTVAPLASNPAIQTQVATRVSQELITRTNIQQRVKEALPSRAGFLATPITDEVQKATYSITLKAVESQKFQQLWTAANRASHKQLVALLTGSSQGAVSAKDGKVTIDLGKVEATVKQDLSAKGITIFNKVPAVKGVNYVLFQSKDLVRVQRLTKLFNDLVVVLPILTLLFFAAAVVLSRNRRRGLVRAATGLALSMVVVLVVVNVARNQYLSGLSPSQSKAANAAVIDTVSAPLTDTVRTVLILAAIVAILAVVFGLAVVKRLMADRRLPGWMTGGPVHTLVAAHRKGLQWAVLAVGLLVLVVWSKPTALVAVVVVLITLAVVGLVGLLAGRRPSPPEATGLEPGDAPPAVGAGSGSEDAVTH